MVECAQALELILSMREEKKDEGRWGKERKEGDKIARSREREGGSEKGRKTKSG